MKVLTRDSDLRFAVNNIYHGVKRCGMLAECLARIKGEKGYRTGFLSIMVRLTTALSRYSTRFESFITRLIKLPEPVSFWLRSVCHLHYSGNSFGLVPICWNNVSGCRPRMQVVKTELTCLAKLTELRGLWPDAHNFLKE
jgi:hypothetical protein